MLEFRHVFSPEVEAELNKHFRVLDPHQAEQFYMKNIEVFTIDEEGHESLIEDAIELEEEGAVFAVAWDNDKMTVRNLIKWLLIFPPEDEVVFNHGETILKFEDLGRDDYSDITDIFLKE